MIPITLKHGRNDLLYDSDGAAYIDLFAGYGSVMLGHANTAIAEALKRQVDKLWISGKYRHDGIDETRALIDSFLSDSYRAVELYSTGMEALEFSLRIGAVTSGRNAYAGFANSMHGKSLATASAGWNNPFSLPNFYRIPFIDAVDEREVLEYAGKLFRSNDIAAFLIEPIQGSAGGHEASPGFYRELVDLCRLHGVVSIVDEVLTGFYRAGYASYSLAHDIQPDILVFGKSIGNGFPVSVVVARKGVAIHPGMLPQSTFSSNPLACAAVRATLGEMQRLDIASRVNHIHARVLDQLGPLQDRNFALRGNGALWIIEPPESCSAIAIGNELLARNVLATFNDKYLRLLPAATMSDLNLGIALDSLVMACNAAAAGAGLNGGTAEIAQAVLLAPDNAAC